MTNSRVLYCDVMKERDTEIIKQNELAPGIFDMRIREEEIARAAVPGQFLSLYSSDLSRLLPRPVSICGAESGEIRLVYRIAGEGTREFSSLKEGDRIRVMGPLGNGFPGVAAFSGKKAVLFGGGIGIPPMLFAAKQMMAAGASVTAVLGYRDKDTFLSEEFAPFAEVLIATEDGSRGTRGNVMDAFSAGKIKADVMFACGPLPMLRAIRTYALENEIPCFLSLEERMACGVGACLGCVTKTVKEDPHSYVNNARVCKDGPVFPAEEITI